mgnify:FL=1
MSQQAPLFFRVSRWPRPNLTTGTHVINALGCNPKVVLISLTGARDRGADLAIFRGRETLAIPHNGLAHFCHLDVQLGLFESGML